VRTIFSSLVYTGPGVHPTNYTMKIQSLWRVNLPGHGVDHIPTASAEVKDRIRAVIPLPLWVFMGIYRANSMKEYINPYPANVENRVSS
jgi:hypothetical protein